MESSLRGYLVYNVNVIILVTGLEAARLIESNQGLIQAREEVIDILNTALRNQ